MATKIQLRRDTAANWASANPTMAQGEIGIETDTQKQKIGDGTTAWNDLVYSTKLGNYHLEPGENDIGTQNGSITIDWSVKSSQKITLNSDATFSFSNGENGGAYTLRVIQDGYGSHGVSWDAAIDWGADGAPTLSTGGGKIDLFNFYYADGKWHGSYKLGYTS